MRITITKAHIDGAVRENSRRCMIADAIKEQVPNAKQVIVDAQSIRWTDPTKDLRYTFMTPPEGQQRLIAFDAGKVIQPFTIEIGEPVLIRSTHVDNLGHKNRTVTEKATRSAKATRYIREGMRELNQRRYATAKRQFGLRVFGQNQPPTKEK